MSGTLDRARTTWASPRMQRAWSVVSWILLIGLVVLVIRRYVPDYSLPDLGPAPELAYTSLDGDVVELADFRGQVVVVNLWATWCPPCVVETPGFVDLAAEFDGEVQFLGISADQDTSTIRPFAARYGVTYPLLVGANLAGPPLDASVLPTTMLIDRQGRVRMLHEGLLLEPVLRPALSVLAKEPSPFSSLHEGTRSRW